MRVWVVPDDCRAGVLYQTAATGAVRWGTVLLAMVDGLVVLGKYHSLFSWTALPTIHWLDYVLYDAAGSCDVGWW